MYMYNIFSKPISKCNVLIFHLPATIFFYNFIFRFPANCICHLIKECLIVHAYKHEFITLYMEFLLSFI